jgi:hypothetical protein
MCNAPIEKIFNTLRRFYRSRPLSHWDAEDMTQDVMCKLLSMGRYDEIGLNSRHSREGGNLFRLDASLRWYDGVGAV